MRYKIKLDINAQKYTIRKKIEENTGMAAKFNVPVFLSIFEQIFFQFG